MDTISPQAKNFKKKTGAMLVAAGIYSRIYARQYFCSQNFEITPEQFVIIEVLMERDGLYQRQLCEITMKDRPNMTRIVNILEHGGYVKRVEDKNKRKVYKIFLTQKARELYPKMEQATLDIRNTITKDINKEDMDTCLTVLNKVLDNLLDKVDMHV